MNNALSSEFTLGRGVRQGSVLSPSLFLIVIDDLLKKLADLNQGVEFNGHYTGTMGRGVARGGLRGLEHPPHLLVWAGFNGYIASTVFIPMVTIESISTQLTTHTILPLIKQFSKRTSPSEVSAYLG